MKNFGFFCVFTASIILFILDLLTTLINFKYLSWIELNPVYVWTGSLIPIIILNLIMFTFFYHYYNRKKSPSWLRYWIIIALSVLIIFRIIAIHNAITWIGQEIPTEVMNKVYTTEQRTSSQHTLYLSLYSPLIFCILTFMLWNLDHKTYRKDLIKTKRK